MSPCEASDACYETAHRCDHDNQMFLRSTDEPSRGVEEIPCCSRDRSKVLGTMMARTRIASDILIPDVASDIDCHVGHSPTNPPSPGSPQTPQSPQSPQSCDSLLSNYSSRCSPHTNSTCCRSGLHHGTTKSCFSDCFGETLLEETISAVTSPIKDTTISSLLRSRTSLGEMEHLIFSVHGMTCAGCENKLTRTLRKIDCVSHVKTSLVLSRAEFDYDPRALTPAELKLKLEKSTGFELDQITETRHYVDVIMPADVASSLNDEKVLGVKAITSRGQSNTYRIDYDPIIIGARDILKCLPIAAQLAPLESDPLLATNKKQVRREAFMTILSAALTVPVLVLAWSPVTSALVRPQYASLVLATLVQVLIVGPFYPSAIKSLLYTRVIEMDLLVVLSTSIAYIFSVISFIYTTTGHSLSTGSFFETSTLLITLVMVGRLVSSIARQRAIESISMRSLQLPTALLIDRGEAREIDVRLIQYNDIFRMLPETRAVTDGVVVSGSSDVDESSITGEAIPIEKSAGDSIVAGSVNGSGCLLVRVTRLPSENTVSSVANMVDEAKLSKPKTQEMADRVAGYFVPLIIAIAVGVFCVWMFVNRGIRNEGLAAAAVQSVTYAIAVLIVSCPCAIGLAVPMVLVVAGGVAANRGIVFKSAEPLERAHKVDHVVFDKTGTLTLGQLSVADGGFINRPEHRACDAVFSLLGASKHPVATAVAKHLESEGSKACTVEQVQSLPGKGVEGVWNGERIRAGNSRWLEALDHSIVQLYLRRGLTTFCIAYKEQLIAVFGLKDSIRPDAASTIANLTRSGIEVSILSGDDEKPVHAVAAALNIPTSHVHARCSPSDKQVYIQAMLSPVSSQQTIDSEKTTAQSIRSWVPNFHRTMPNAEAKHVLYVGDGTNDAIALATATVGVHMPSASLSVPRDTNKLTSSGSASSSSSFSSPPLTSVSSTVGTASEVAQSAASITLLNPSLALIPTLIAISRSAHRRIVFNFAWAFAYNTLAVMLAAGVFVSFSDGARQGVRIAPAYAGLGELVSVAPVVIAAVGLRWVRF